MKRMFVIITYPRKRTQVEFINYTIKEITRKSEYGDNFRSNMQRHGFAKAVAMEIPDMRILFNFEGNKSLGNRHARDCYHYIIKKIEQDRKLSQYLT